MNKRSISKRILYIVISAFCFALMNLFISLSGELPFVQKSFFRNLIAFIAALFLLFRRKQRIEIYRGNIKDLLLRSIFGTVGISCNFYAVDRLFIADASMLNKMSPFFAVIFSFFMLREKISLFQTIVVISAFAGSMLVVKPSVTNMDFLPGLIGLCGGICAGAAYTYVRKLGNGGTKGTVTVIFFSGFSCLVTLPFLLFDYHTMTLVQLGWLLLAGLAATGGQFAITAAYCHAPAKEISVYDYSQILFSVFLGYVVFGQIPDWYSILGYIIIISVAISMFLYNLASKEPASASG